VASGGYEYRPDECSGCAPLLEFFKLASTASLDRIHASELQPIIIVRDERAIYGCGRSIILNIRN
jgi:hypothetical protein